MASVLPQSFVETKASYSRNHSQVILDSLLRSQIIKCLVVVRVHFRHALIRRK